MHNHQKDQKEHVYVRIKNKICCLNFVKKKAAWDQYLVARLTTSSTSKKIKCD